MNKAISLRHIHSKSVMLLRIVKQISDSDLCKRPSILLVMIDIEMLDRDHVVSWVEGLFGYLLLLLVLLGSWYFILLHIEILNREMKSSTGLTYDVTEKSINKEGWLFKQSRFMKEWRK